MYDEFLMFIASIICMENGVDISSIEPEDFEGCADQIIADFIYTRHNEEDRDGD